MVLPVVKKEDKASTKNAARSDLSFAAPILNKLLDTMYGRDQKQNRFISEYSDIKSTEYRSIQNNNINMTNILNSQSETSKLLGSIKNNITQNDANVTASPVQISSITKQETQEISEQKSKPISASSISASSILEKDIPKIVIDSIKKIDNYISAQQNNLKFYQLKTINEETSKALEKSASLLSDIEQNIKRHNELLKNINDHLENQAQQEDNTDNSPDIDLERRRSNNRPQARSSTPNTPSSAGNLARNLVRGAAGTAAGVAVTIGAIRGAFELSEALTPEERKGAIDPLKKAELAIAEKIKIKFIKDIEPFKSGDIVNAKDILQKFEISDNEKIEFLKQLFDTKQIDIASDTPASANVTPDAIPDASQVPATPDAIPVPQANTEQNDAEKILNNAAQRHQTAIKEQENINRERITFKEKFGEPDTEETIRPKPNSNIRFSPYQVQVYSNPEAQNQYEDLNKREHAAKKQRDVAFRDAAKEIADLKPEKPGDVNRSSIRMQNSWSMIQALTTRYGYTSEQLQKYNGGPTEQNFIMINGIRYSPAIRQLFDQELNKELSKRASTSETLTPVPQVNTTSVPAIPDAIPVSITSTPVPQAGLTLQATPASANVTPVPATPASANVTPDASQVPATPVPATPDAIPASANVPATPVSVTPASNIITDNKEQLYGQLLQKYKTEELALLNPGSGGSAQSEAITNAERKASKESGYTPPKQAVTPTTPDAEVQKRDELVSKSISGAFERKSNKPRVDQFSPEFTKRVDEIYQQKLKEEEETQGRKLLPAEKAELRNQIIDEELLSSPSVANSNPVVTPQQSETPVSDAEPVDKDLLSPVSQTYMDDTTDTGWQEAESTDTGWQEAGSEPTTRPMARPTRTRRQASEDTSDSLTITARDVVFKSDKMEAPFLDAIKEELSDFMNTIMNVSGQGAAVTPNLAGGSMGSSGGLASPVSFANVSGGMRPPTMPSFGSGSDTSTQQGQDQSQSQGGTSEKPENVTIDSGVDISKVDKDLLGGFYAAAKEYGKPVKINSGFRSDEKQAELWVRGRIFKEPGIYMPAKPDKDTTINYKGQTFNVPGGRTKSSHGGSSSSARALDVTRNALEEMDSMGLLRKYGLHRPFPNDPVHVERIGGRSAPPDTSTDGAQQASQVSATPMTATASGGESTDGGGETATPVASTTSDGGEMTPGGGDQPASMTPSTPSSGPTVATASVDNEVAKRTPMTPSAPTPDVPSSGTSSPGVGDTSYPISMGNPGNVEPPDAAQRYALLFDMAA